ncbi:hypothetical protein HanIR_Chr14g0683471 [Helianthus annuus]|nr:hypothetical protein HanIR_Chr14g0683471 [Helianthus annuus]
MKPSPHHNTVLPLSLSFHFQQHKGVSAAGRFRLSSPVTHPHQNTHIHKICREREQDEGERERELRTGAHGWRSRSGGLSFLSTNLPVVDDVNDGGDSRRWR